MKKSLKILILCFLVISCNNKDDEPTNPLTESIVENGIKYGSEDRQFFDLYKPESDCPTPIYFDAHFNGGSTTSISPEIIADLNTEGITVISWESLTSVGTPEEVEMGWNDAELMFQWVIDNAETYNLDISNIIIGGSSRGSILSWVYGHRPNTNIKGLYFYNALPSTVWQDPSWWLPTENVTLESPPIYFVYKREPGSSSDPINPDIHDPNNGIAIVNRYESLGIGNRTTLVHSIEQSNNTDRYQFLVDFALSVIETCP